MKSTRATLEAGARLIASLAITEAERDLVLGTIYAAAALAIVLVIAAVMV